MNRARYTDVRRPERNDTRVERERSVVEYRNKVRNGEVNLKLRLTCIVHRSLFERLTSSHQDTFSFSSLVLSRIKVSLKK